MPTGRSALLHEQQRQEFDSFYIDGTTITFDATQPDGSAVIGRACSLSADDTVKLAADGEAIIGKLISVEKDGVATVQVEGVMSLPKGNGATITRGSKHVGALDAGSNPGFVRVINSATAAELIKAGPVCWATLDPNVTGNAVFNLP